MTLNQRCLQIETILSDVDGVLTDGRITLDNRGNETKRFNNQDGMGIKLWQSTGRRFGLITLRNSEVVNLRAAELGIEIIRQGTVDKRPTFEEILAELGLTAEQACYLGDDLPDLPVIRAAGLGVAVADACTEVCEAADYVTKAPGGSGAVRETIELILKTQGRWQQVIRPYTQA